MTLKLAKNKFLITILVFFTGLLLSLFMFFIVRGWEKNLLLNEFKERSSDRLELFEIHIEDHIHVLQSLSSLYIASHKVEPDEFHKFTLGLRLSHLDIISFDWLPLVKSAQRLEFEKSIQQQGFTDFKITQEDGKGGFIRSQDENFYFPLVYIEPFEKNKIRFGFDVYRSEIRRLAMDKAIDTGLPIVTAGFVPPGETSNDLACRVYLAVYKNGLPHQTTEERRENLFGFVSVLFRVGDTLEESLTNFTSKGIDIEVYDITPGGKRQALYYRPAKLKYKPSFKDQLFAPIQFNWDKKFEVSGRTWLFVTHSCPEFFQGFIFWQSWMVLILGMIVTLIVVVYLLEILRRTDKIENLVNEKTLELQESEEKYRSLVQNANSIILRMDTKGNIVFFNDFAKKFFGFSEDEIMGKNVFGTIVPSNSSFGTDLSGLIEKIVNHPNMYITNENENMLRSGKRVWISWTNKAIYNRQGNVDGILSIGNDITGIREAQIALKLEKDRAELLYKVVPSAIFSVDLERRITSWNDKAAELTGYSAQEVMGKNCTIFADLPCKDACGLYNKNLSEPVINIECAIIRKDGVRRIISKNADLLKDNTGNIIGGIESFEDITERKEYDENLRKLSSAIEQSPAVTVITDKGGNIQYVNPKFTKITGYSLVEVIGKNPKILKSGEVSQDGYRDLWEVISRGDEWRGEFHNRKKDGSLYWEYASISSVKDNKGIIQYFIKVAEDITERKKLEKLKDEFVSNVSHELRTPLSIIKEGVSLVLDQVVGEINPKQKAVLNTSKDNIDRLSRIINELLDISKIESGKLILHKENIDLVDLVKNTAFLFENRIKEKGLELKINFSDPQIVAYIDKDRIIQIFINLIDNAIKFTDKGCIAVLVVNHDKEIECSVEDSGRGISQEDLPKLFSKFEQFGRIPVGGNNKGTGLGLSIVKALVVSHGGNINLTSNQQQGSKFTFTLPKELV